MPKPELHWTTGDVFELLVLIEEINARDGVASLMYGGYGHYYKLSWVIGGEKGYATGETVEALIKLASTRLQGR